MIGGFVQADQRELLAPYTEKYFASIKRVSETRSHEIVQQIVVGLYPTLQVSQETLLRLAVGENGVREAGMVNA